jgi:hypothetical protein
MDVSNFCPKGGSRVTKHVQQSPKIFIYLPFCHHTLRRDFSLWTGRHARSHVRTKFGRRRVPKLATFSRTIARRSPLGGTRKGTALPDLRAEAILWRRRACCRIGCMLRTGRLLVDHTKGTEGSNLTLSATQSELQRNSAATYPKIRETCPYFAIFRPQTGLERMDCSAAKSLTVLAFLWGAHAQSGFEKALGECNASKDRGFGQVELTFASTLEPLTWDRIISALQAFERNQQRKSELSPKNITF